MFRKFKFEEEFYEKLSDIPLSTRFKLDRIGIQLSAQSWNRFSHEEKLVLCHLSVRSQGELECYKEYLLYLLQHTHEKAIELDPEISRKEKAQWENLSRVPESVYMKALAFKALITVEDWIRLDDLERYVLFKLAEDQYNEAHLAKALEEFMIIPSKKPAKTAKAS